MVARGTADRLVGLAGRALDWPADGCWEDGCWANKEDRFIGVVAGSIRLLAGRLDSGWTDSGLKPGGVAPRAGERREGRRRGATATFIGLGRRLHPPLGSGFSSSFSISQNQFYRLVRVYYISLTLSLAALKRRALHRWGAR